MLCFTNYCNDDYVDSAIHTDESTDDDARPDTDEVVESRLVAGRCWGAGVCCLVNLTVVEGGTLAARTRDDDDIALDP